MDIVIPKNNEKEFLHIAKKLGQKEITFLYNFEEYLEKKEVDFGPSIKTAKGIIADTRNIQRINNKFKDKKPLIAIKSSNRNREFIEKKYISLIFNLEENSRKDFMHQRGSGLDHIMAKLMHENKITLGMSFSQILNSKNRHQIIGRMMQNIGLCRKYKVKAAIASFAENPYEMRSSHDLESFFKLLNKK